MSMRPLNLYWNGDRKDNFVTATREGQADAIKAGYKFVRTEGWIPGENPNLPHLAPRELKLFWSAQRNDNYTTSTPEGEAAAKGAGYVFVRNEGYVFTGARAPGPQELLLESFWKGEDRMDNFTCAQEASKAAATGAGYKKVRPEGFVAKAEMPGGTGGMWRFHHPHGSAADATQSDNWTAMTPQSALEAAAEGYQFLESVSVPHHLNAGPGMIPLKLYWSAERKDHFLTGNADGEKGALQANYVLKRIEAWIYPAAPPAGRAQAVKAWWNKEHSDNFTTFSDAQEAQATQHGYKLVRTEGYLSVL